MQNVSIGDILHEMSNPVFLKNKKNISIGRLLRILQSMQSINSYS